MKEIHSGQMNDDNILTEYKFLLSILPYSLCYVIDNHHILKPGEMWRIPYPENSIVGKGIFKDISPQPIKHYFLIHKDDIEEVLKDNPGVNLRRFWAAETDEIQRLMKLQSSKVLKGKRD